MLARVPPGPIVGAIAVAGLWLMSSAPTAESRVPDVEGLEVNAAIARAAKAGYFTKVSWQRAGGIAGTVVDQSPEGRLMRDRGSRIVLVVTRGAAQVRVPDVRGVDVEEARRRLDRGHLVPGAVTYRNEKSYRSNRVITTVPRPGKLVDVGETVDLVAAA